jgi:hypothetical protein
VAHPTHTVVPPLIPPVGRAGERHRETDALTGAVQLPDSVVWEIYFNYADFDPAFHHAVDKGQ